MSKMRMTFRLIRSAALLVALVASLSARAEGRASFADVARKKADVTIVVTDSGLGGLSVAADLAARLRGLWEGAFDAAGYPGVRVLDPNPLMTDLVLRAGGEKRFPKTAVTVEAVSKVPIDEATRANLGSLLRAVSPETADALAHVRHDPALFPAVVDPAAILAR